MEKFSTKIFHDKIDFTIFEKKINFGFSEFINYIKVSDYNTKLDKI